MDRDERYILVEPRIYAEIVWYAEEVRRWHGRDRRRIKREHNKFIQAARGTYSSPSPSNG